MVPVISGTVAGQTVAAGGTINPFSNTSVSDGNPYVHDTLTISLLDSTGNATDATGALTLSGNPANVTFSKAGAGVYVLTDLTPYSDPTFLSGLNSALPALTFIPSGAGTTTFSLFDLSVDTVNFTHSTTDSTTTVSAGGASTAPATPVSNVATPADTTPSAPTTLADTTSSTPADTTPSTPVDTTPVTLAVTPPTTSTDTSTSPDIHLTGSVAASQTFDLSQGDGHLLIDRPRQFHGTINLGSGDIDLRGLARADSFSFQNDMLSILGAGRTLASLHITGGSDFAVEKTSTGISIYTPDDTHHTADKLLPLHT